MIKYGGGTADFAFYKGEIIPGQKYTLWDENDNQLTNLWDAGGVPVPDSQVQADVFGMVEFYTEDGVFPVYAKAVGDTSGLKVRMDPSTITEDLYDTIATTSGLSSRVGALEGSQATQDGEIATIGDQINAILDELATPGGAGLSSRAVLFLDDTAFGAIGDGVNDDAPAFQAAFDQLLVLGGGTLFVPAGIFKLNSEVEIKSACRVIMDPNALVIRGNSTMQYMFRNFNSTYAPTGYNGRGNIEFTGGIIDGGATTLTTSCTSLIFAHADNVKVSNVLFRNVVDWHAIELNSCRNSSVKDCTFEGFRLVTAGRDITEAVQIDGAFNSSVLPGIGSGAYDNTMCTNILIDGNTVRTGSSYGSFGRLVGSHSSITTDYHNNIKVVNNTAYSTRDYAVNALNWRHVVVSNNYFGLCNGFFKADISSAQDMYNYLISDNVVDTAGIQNSSPAILAYALLINGKDVSGAGNVFRDVTITGNVFQACANGTAVVKCMNIADLDFADNTIKTTSVDALEVLGCSNCRVSSNKFVTVTGRGMYMHRGTNINNDYPAVIGNVWNGCGPVFITTVSGPQFGNNNITTSSGTCALQIDNSNHAVITGNQIRRNSLSGATTGVILSNVSNFALMVGNVVDTSGTGWAANTTLAGASGQAVWVSNGSTNQGPSMSSIKLLNDIGL